MPTCFDGEQRDAIPKLSQRRRCHGSFSGNDRGVRTVPQHMVRNTAAFVSLPFPSVSTHIIPAAMGASCSLMFPFSSSDSPPQDNDSSMMEEGRTGDSPASSVGNKTTSTMSTMKRSASPVVGSPTSMEDEDPEAGDQVKILLLGAGESGKCETADAD